MVGSKAPLTSKQAWIALARSASRQADRLLGSTTTLPAHPTAREIQCPHARNFRMGCQASIPPRPKLTERAIDAAKQAIFGWKCVGSSISYKIRFRESHPPRERWLECGFTLPKHSISSGSSRSAWWDARLRNLTVPIQRKPTSCSSNITIQKHSRVTLPSPSASTSALSSRLPFQYQLPPLELHPVSHQILEHHPRSPDLLERRLDPHFRRLPSRLTYIT